MKKIYIVKYEHTSFCLRMASYRFEGIFEKFYHTEEEAEEAIKAEIEILSQSKKEHIVGRHRIDFKDDAYRYAIETLTEA